MAEGWARALAAELPPYLKVDIQSAGLEAQGLNPLAIAVMKECGVDISGQESTLLTAAMLQQADLLVTVCSHADRNCPAVPSSKRKIHLPFDDPAAAGGTEQQIHAEFCRIRDEIKEAVASLLHQLLLETLQQAGGNVFDQSDTQIVTREPAYQGFIPVDVLQLRHRLFAGGWSETMRRELAVRPRAVGVLLYDPRREDLVMIKQFRTGAVGCNQSPWMLEIVAGLADPDEQPVDVARREAKEEANCEISALVPVCEYFNSPGWCDEQITLFCAIVDSTALQGIHGLDDEHEDILTVTVPLKKAAQMIQNGEINNAMSIIAIQWLQLNLHRFHDN
jgi:ADP-ribose pyrophosphatase